MANRSWSDAITFVTANVRGIPLADIDETFADIINTKIWRAFPWSWTLAALTSIALVEDQQDYSMTVGDAAAIMRLTKTWITKTDSDPDQVCDIMPWKWLAPNLAQDVGWPNFSYIHHERRSNKLRLEAKVSLATSETLFIDGEYQTNPTKITDPTTAIVHPDRYFDVIVSGIMWLAFKFANDKRAGSSVVVNGQVQYTGQLGEFHDSLISMAEAESYGIQFNNHPEEPLIDFDL